MNTSINSTSSRNHSARCKATIYTSDYVEYLDKTQIELEGLRHIDIRITPPRRQLDVIDGTGIGSRKSKEQKQGERAPAEATCTARLLSTDQMQNPMPNTPKEEPKLDSTRNPDIAKMSGSGDRNPRHVSSRFPNSQSLTPLRSEYVDVLCESHSKPTGQAKLVQADEDDREQKDTVIKRPSARTNRSELQGIFNRYREAPVVEPLPMHTLTQNDLVREPPPGAKWTKISRILVNPEALEQAGEIFEEREDSVIVFGLLTRDEIEHLAEITEQIQEGRERRWQAEATRRQRKKAQQRLRIWKRVEKRAGQ